MDKLINMLYVVWWVANKITSASFYIDKGYAVGLIAHHMYNSTHK